MNPLERTNDPRVSLAAATKARQSLIWTALPGKITKVNDMAGRMTVEVQPQIIITINNLNLGKRQNVPMPPIPDCPVLFPGGGGFHLTFPVAPGDECLLFFSSRCIDGWWSTGAMAPQGDLRMHDLSDGFALVGVRSLPNVLNPAPNPNTVQLRSDDGACYIELAGHAVNIVAPAGLTVNATGGTGAVTVNAQSATVTTVGNASVEAGGAVQISAGAGAQVTAVTGIQLTAPTGTIKANSNVLG